MTQVHSALHNHKHYLYPTQNQLHSSYLHGTSMPFLFMLTCSGIHQKIPLWGPWLLPPTSAVEVIVSVPCFCVSACQLVSALTAKPLDIWTQKLVGELSLIKSRTSSLVKVIGQRSRSRDQKRDFQGFLIWVTPHEI